MAREAYRQEKRRSFFMTQWFSFSFIKEFGSLLTKQWLRGGDFRHKRHLRRMEKA
jgi:hypothetical protein